MKAGYTDIYDKQTVPKVAETTFKNKVLDSAETAPEPLLKNVWLKNQLADQEEYGYGFYMRYLTYYPVKQAKGKSQPWYFMSRMTQNNPHTNIDNMGDRLLCIWQGPDGYYFVTYTLPANKNLYTRITYDIDIEGAWTYVYLSASRKANKVMGWLQYPGKAPKSITLDAVHSDFSYLEFYLGGAIWYPAFNGQFANVVYGLGKDRYVSTAAQL